jgi:CelD/BcsL family acetyltransferase involved in cellulose biosynthesis
VSNNVSSAARWQVHSAHPPAEWWQQWDALNARYFSEHPLLSAAMARALITHCPAAAMCYGTLRTGSDIVGMAVLSRHGSGRWSVFTPSQAPLSLVLIDPAFAQPYAVLGALLAKAPGVGLSLDVPALDPSLLPSQTAAAPSVEKVSLGTTIQVAETNGFEAYWNTRSRDLKQNIRRYFKRATEAGTPCRLERVTEPDKIGAAVDRYGLLESEGWKGRDGTALHPQNAQGRLYRELLETFAKQGNAVAYELWAGDQFAASRLMISGPRMHVMLKTTYSEALRQHAPGRLLLYLALEDLLKAPQARPVEFFTRANQDLLIWATGTRELFSSTIYRNSAVQLAVGLRRRLRARPAATPQPQES